MLVNEALQVCKTALLDAQSVASLMMTAEAFVADAPEDKPAPDPMAGGGMGGMGGMM